MTHATFDAQTDLKMFRGRATAVGAPACAARDGVQISIHHDLHAVEHDWRAFEQHADGTVFQTFDFVATYCRHVGVAANVGAAIVIGRDSAGSILFLLPLGIEGQGMLRRLAWLGSELCDYNGPLLAPSFSSRVGRSSFPAIWNTILSQLKSVQDWRYDLVDLDKMPEAVGAQENPFLALTTSLHPSGAYVTPIGGDWEQFYLGKRSASSRKRDRAKRRKLAELGAVSVVTPDRDDDIARTIDLLMAQKAVSFASMGVANMFERPGYRAFFHGLATSPRSRSLVHVSRLQVADHVAAVNLGLQFHGRYYHVLASYDPGETARIGAGAVHLQELMQCALAKGCTTFDFTIGDEAYKREWCDTTTPLHDHISSSGIGGVIAIAQMRLKRRIKRRIKQTPALWNAFLKMRALVGARRGR